MACSDSDPHATDHEDMIAEIPTSCVTRINAVLVSTTTVAIA